VEYAPYVEYGTKYSKRPGGKPYLRPALDRNRQAIIKLMADKIRSAIRD
jgi:hypothetical protein